MDRSYALGSKLRNKVGGVISVASSVGHTGVLNIFSSYFKIRHMFAADFVTGFAREKGDMLRDRHAMQASKELGKQVVLMVKQKLEFPKEYDIPIYMIVHRDYGIDRSPARGRFDK